MKREINDDLHLEINYQSVTDSIFFFNTSGFSRTCITGLTHYQTVRIKQNQLEITLVEGE